MDSTLAWICCSSAHPRITADYCVSVCLSFLIRKLHPASIIATTVMLISKLGVVRGLLGCVWGVFGGCLGAGAAGDKGGAAGELVTRIPQGSTSGPPQVLQDNPQGTQGSPRDPPQVLQDIALDTQLGPGVPSGPPPRFYNARVRVNFRM